ncbi:MAG: YkvA family protein [Haloferacaceae archaeon]
MSAALASLRERIDRLRREVAALSVALVDPRTPWYAKAVLALTVGLAASPIDPIPDVVPVLGYLDDLVFVPAGILLARALTPEGVLADARERAAEGAVPRRIRWGVAALIVLGWLVTAVLLALLVGLPG